MLKMINFYMLKLAKTSNKKAIVITTIILGVVAIIISIIIFVHKPKREKENLIYMETY